MGLTNAQYDSIMRQYSERQSENHRILLARRDEIAKKIPNYTRLGEEIASLSMEYAIASLDDSATHMSADEYSAKLSDLANKRKELLTSHGYSVDYLDPIYTCSDCEDTGFIDSTPCHCFRRAVTELFYLGSNNKNINPNETFEHFDLNVYSKDCVDPKTGKNAYDHMNSVLQAAERYVREFDQHPEDYRDSKRNLLFYGNTGLGKTFLTNCIANELKNDGQHSVIYLTAIELFQTFSKSEFERDSDYKEIADEILECDLLIIDDLGTELSNSFTNSRLFLCINERMIKNKATIISTNLSLDNLCDNYSDRIFSRIMHAYRPVRFFGNDIRLAAFARPKA